MNRSGVNAMRHRDDFKYNASPWIYTDGKHADFARIVNANDVYSYDFNLNSGDFADYHMSGDEYFDMVTSKYRDNSDSITVSDMPTVAKQYAQLLLNNDFLDAFANYRYFLSHNYRAKHNAWRERFIPLDSIPAELTDDQLKKVVEMVDPSDSRMLLANSTFGGKDWTDYGASNDLSKSLGMYANAVRKAQALTLTDEDLDQLRSLSNPFFAEASDSIYQRANRLSQKLAKENLVQTTPDVAADKVFDAIVAPHLGKVVVVDLWNTWCGPCRAALKSNEPLKSGELANDDIVWIYIANETSPMPTYLSMLPNINGLHYRLNDEQWQALASRFEVDGIPYYIIVDRKGKASGRPDLRDHNLYIKTIKEELAK